MADLIKDVFSPEFIRLFARHLDDGFPGLDEGAFYDEVFTKTWKGLEFKQRMSHISSVMHRLLPDDYPTNLEKLIQVTERTATSDYDFKHLELIFVPDYIARFGLKHFDESVAAMHCITRWITCEFAVRPFLINYPDAMMNILNDWSKDENAQVRRLATEGCRPRLPWAVSVPHLKSDPSPILPILERLKNDDSESVRRSVANNLNDISKDHPDLCVGILKRWHGRSDQLDALVKHAGRTLLKQGHEQVLDLFGQGYDEDLVVSGLDMLTPVVKTGEHLSFRFRIENRGPKPKKLRLEYKVHFLKANGQLSPKIFKISERTIEGHSGEEIVRNHSFRIITTRTYHPGQHGLSVVVNGKEFGYCTFKLEEA